MILFPERIQGHQAPSKSSYHQFFVLFILNTSSAWIPARSTSGPPFRSLRPVFKPSPAACQVILSIYTSSLLPTRTGGPRATGSDFPVTEPWTWTSTPNGWGQRLMENPSVLPCSVPGRKPGWGRNCTFGIQICLNGGSQPESRKFSWAVNRLWWTPSKPRSVRHGWVVFMWPTGTAAWPRRFKTVCDGSRRFCRRTAFRSRISRSWEHKSDTTILNLGGTDGAEEDGTRGASAWPFRRPFSPTSLGGVHLKDAGQGRGRQMGSWGGVAEGRKCLLQRRPDSPAVACNRRIERGQPRGLGVVLGKDYVWVLVQTALLPILPVWYPATTRASSCELGGPDCNSLGDAGGLP